jgi:hypothetical protein
METAGDGPNEPLPEFSSGDQTIPTFEADPLFEADEKQSEAAAAFLEACEAFAKGENKDAQGLYNLHLQSASSFVTYIQAMFRAAPDNPTGLKLLEAELFKDDDRRMNKFSEISPGRVMFTSSSKNPAYVDGGLLRNLTTMFEQASSRDSFLQAWAESYTAVVQSEVLGFLNSTQQSFEQATEDKVEMVEQPISITINMPEESKPSLRQQIGKNALDVAKLAGGIALGFALGDRLFRKGNR